MPAIVPVGGNDQVTPGEGVAEIQNASPLGGPAAVISSAPQVITGLRWGYGWGYLKVTFRLPKGYCRVTLRLPKGYCKIISIEFLRGYLGVAVGLP